MRTGVRVAEATLTPAVRTTPRAQPVPTVAYTGQDIREIVLLHTANDELIEDVVDSYTDIAEEDAAAMRRMATSDTRIKEGWTVIQQAIAIILVFAILGGLAYILPTAVSLLVLRASGGGGGGDIFKVH